jgi:hypothetical protein
MSRRVYLLGVGLALVTLAFLLTEELLWQPGVTEANVKRIRLGMAPEEVTAIFGKESDRAIELGDGVWVWQKWYGEAGAADVTFTDDGRARSARWIPGRWRGSPPHSPQLVSRLRAWLGW